MNAPQNDETAELKKSNLALQESNARLQQAQNGSLSIINGLELKVAKLERELALLKSQPPKSGV